MQNLVKRKNDNLLADYPNILNTNRYKKYFSWKLNAYGLNYVRQTEMHM
jgi:hypothetical protein